MGGKSNASSKEAKRARAEEEARQQRIRQGTGDINRIFDGGLTGTGALGAGAAFDPNATYYNADGTKWTPAAQIPAAQTAVASPAGQWNTNDMGVFGAPSATAPTSTTPQLTGPTAAEQFAQRVASGSLFSGVQQSGGFNDAFYRGIRDSFTNYAMPQLQQQRDEAARDLTFDLDRKGQLASSVRGQKTGELQKLFELNEQQVRDQALAHENTARNNVENARSDLVAMLNATGDNQQAVNSALSRATILTQPQAYSPLGQLFTDFTAQLSNQAARERAEAASGGLYKAPFNTGLFGGTGRVDVRR